MPLDMVQRQEIAVTAVFVFLAIGVFLWGQSAEIGDKMLYGILIGIGIVVPTIITSFLFD